MIMKPKLTDPLGRVLSLLVLSALTCSGNLAYAQVTRSFTEPYERIEISASEPGVIGSILVKEGTHVEAGKLLGSLDNRVLAQSLLLAEIRAKSTAKVDAAIADMQTKRKLFDNLAPLLRSGQANPSEVERAESAYKQAEANLRLARDEARLNAIEMDRIKAQIGQRSFESPIEGYVIAIHHRKGEYLSSSKPEFATVVQLSRLRAKFFVGTAFAETLHQGDTIQTLVGRRRVSAAAKVEFVSPVTDSQSGTVRVDVVIHNSKNKYRSGVVCELVKTPGQRVSQARDRTLPTVPPRREIRQAQNPQPVRRR